MDSSNRLEAFFNPQRIALIGASEKGMYPAGILTSLMENQFQGQLYPINPKRSQVFGIPCYPALEQTPERPDLAILTIPREGVLAALEQCLERGVKAAVVITAGFSEADEEGKRLQVQIAERVRGSGLAVVGPNCAGLANIPAKMIATRIPGPQKSGRISFASQSGALMMALFGVFADRQVGMNRLISLGNQVDVDLNESIQHLAKDSQTRVITCFIEGIRDGRGFVCAASAALEGGKPVIALKSGRTSSGQQAAASHTGAMAGSDRVFQAVCRQFGVVCVDDVNELVDTAQAFEAFGDSKPERLRLAVVTQSGGLGSLTADHCQMNGLTLEPLATDLTAKLAALPHLQGLGGFANPMDVRGPAVSGAMTRETLLPFLTDGNTDAVLLLMAKPMTRADAIETCQAISKAVKETNKPLFVVWVGQKVRPGTAPVRTEAESILLEAGIPLFDQPGSCVRALRHVHEYACYRQKWLKDRKNPWRKGGTL